MKKCKKCLEILPYDFFYQKKGSKDGYENVCTECKKSKARANRAKNREHYLAYDRERNSTLKRIEERKEYGSSYKGKLAQSRYKQANANTVKSKAQLAAKIAIQKGEIQKPLQCEKCKKFTPIFLFLHGTNSERVLHCTKNYCDRLAEEVCHAARWTCTTLL